MPDHLTGGNATKPPSKFDHHAKCISMGPHQRIPQFNEKNLAPIGCPVQAHKKPGNRKTWSDHTIEAWNLGTLMKHHRCFLVYSKATRAERITDTQFFKHKYLTSQSVTPADSIVEAV